MKVVRNLFLKSTNFTIIRHYYTINSTTSVSCTAAGHGCSWNIGRGRDGGGNRNSKSLLYLNSSDHLPPAVHLVKVLGFRRFNSSLAKSTSTNNPSTITPDNDFTQTSSTTSSTFKDLNNNNNDDNEEHQFLRSKSKGGQTIAETIVYSFPKSFQPYLKLSRMDKPIGTWLLFWPCTWGLALAATPEYIFPSFTLLSLFGIGAFIMRGAGCTINDLWDKNIDSKIKRTSNRPLASGELRSRHAVAWLASQLSLSLGILCQLPEPCFLIGVGSLGLVILYPLAKRVTDWPQGVLGLTFNTGILMGYTASVAARAAEISYLSLPWLNPSCLSLYLAGISWTLIYDTIYAHQDREEDTLLGLGSTAKLFGANTKYWLSGFSISMLSSLSIVGYLEGLNWPYYIGLTASALHLAWQIKTLDINNHKDCSKKFTSNRHLGWIIFLSLLASH